MFLALDTSGAVSVALLEPQSGLVMVSRHIYEPRHHAELLMPLVSETLTEAGAKPADLTLIVAGQGPGPFTGLRVGLVTARTMALALDIPVHGVVSLDAVALAAVRQGVVAADFIVATDARRREVYHAAYRVQHSLPQRVSGPSVGAAAALDASDSPAVGRGAGLYPDAFGAVDGGASLLDPEAAFLVQVAWEELGPTPSSARLRDPEPLYLRAPDATVPGARKSVGT